MEKREVPKLEEPKGDIIRVATVDELTEALDNHHENVTILVEDGVYSIERTLGLSGRGVKLRGESGDRGAVVIDGESAIKPMDLLWVHDARDTVIADMTLQNTLSYGIKVEGSTNVDGFLLHNVVMRNCWKRGLKGTWAHVVGAPDYNDPDVQAKIEKVRPCNGEVRFCLFTADHTKTIMDDGFNGDYISGTDMMHLDNWSFHDNDFVGIRGANTGGRGAVFLWGGSRNVTVERNRFLHCDRSIAFGNPSNTIRGMDRAVIHDNLIVGGANKAIECDWTRDVEIFNNIIYTMFPDYPHTVNILNSEEGNSFHHNIVHGIVDIRAEEEPPTLSTENSRSARAELGAEVAVYDNFVGDFEGCFADPERGDLSLTEKGEREFGEWKV